MKLNPLRMEQAAGPEEYAAGRELEEAGRVKVAEQSGNRIRYTVAGQPPASVTLDGDLQMRCDCTTFSMRKAAGTWWQPGWKLNGPGSPKACCRKRRRSGRRN